MIFAAGLGTRLRPLTDTMPKALVPIGGVPLLEHVVQRLLHAGCSELVINVHHFAEQIVDYVCKRRSWGIHVTISDETDELLDTGGGVAQAARMTHTDEPLMIHNVDILGSLDLKAMWHFYIESDATALLAVKERETARYLLFDEKHMLRGWTNRATQQTKPAGLAIDPTWSPLAFSGIHIMGSDLLRQIAQRKGRFSIIDFYLEQMAHSKIIAHPSQAPLLDVGKLNELDIAEAFICNGYAPRT